MKKALSLFVVGLILFSCNSDTEDTRTTVNGTPADSTLATFEGENYSAEWKRLGSRSSGSADGAALWERSGSISSILSELYNDPVDVRSGPDSRQSYQLEIRWDEQVSWDDIRPQVTERLQEELGYSVTTETRDQQAYVLSVPDPERLDTTPEEGFVTPGTASKVSMGAERWQIFAPLSQVASILSEQANRPVVLDRDYGSNSYYVELTRPSGFEDLTRQLEEKYGMDIREETVEREHHTITFP